MLPSIHCGACFTIQVKPKKIHWWEPVDGQHIRSACIDIASAEVKAGSITTTEYESVYSRWAAQVVIYDEPWLYVELSRQVCTI
jgi:hypothetical protein